MIHKLKVICFILLLRVRVLIYTTNEYHYRIFQTIHGTFFVIVWPKSDLQREIIKAYMVILHLRFFDNEKHARAICALLPVTYKDIWWRLNKNNPKIKIRFYKLQDASSEICKKRKGCLVCFRCWRGCSEAIPGMKNSVDFSDLKWDRELSEQLLICYVNSDFVK